MVVDTSAILAVFFNERHGPWVADRLREARTALRMSTVNYAEVLILFRDRQPELWEEMRDRVLLSSIRLVPLLALDRGFRRADILLVVPSTSG